MVESEAVPLGGSWCVHNLSALRFEILSDPVELVADLLVEFFSLEDCGWFDTSFNWALGEIAVHFECIGLGSTVGVKPVVAALGFREAHSDIAA